MEKPIILLAFANDQPQNSGYLRNLSLELNSIKRVLERAEDHQLCQLHILPNATLEDLIHTFQRESFRDRIAIFHYGGHANSYDLMLEDDKGELTSARGEGLIPFLSQQKGLQLVFLNGCFSVKQAKELLDAGIPAVIGTVHAVDDGIATKLSSSFYQALAEGSTIEQSWKEATYLLQAKNSTQELEFYYQKSRDDTRALLMRQNLNQTETRFPWEIHYREGHETIKDWSLAQAANSPYFGLPDIPDKFNYPEEPYQFLQRYKRTDAKIFFGRGNFIRDLYHRLTSPHAAPLLLLYGQSGVGKSSLLEAGLFPRLEGAYEVIYLRRDHKRGLANQLKTILGIDENAVSLSPNDKRVHWNETISQLEEVEAKLSASTYQEPLRNIIDDLKEKQSTLNHLESAGKTDIATAWLKKEAESGKKALILVLDQVEEVFTRPIKGQEDELGQLLALIAEIFNATEPGPRGKIMLSYRKEYDSEMEKAIRSYHLPKEKIFLDRLGVEGIEEVVNGLASTQALKNKYRLLIEEGLPALMAQNLLADRNSPIAPVLQIILTKMWKGEQAKDLRVFSIASYQELKAKGILLDDFFQEQMDQIKQWEAEIQHQVESSGLALDILHYHTTAFQTAGSRSLDELRLHYQHQGEVLERLIKKFQALYLLTASSSELSTLAHDTLAPIVQREIQQSDKPGQRAFRILSSKVLDYQLNPSTTFIDEEDLALVEQGANGMRLWTRMEEELVEKSRHRRAKLEQERKRNRQLKIAGVLIISLLLIMTSFLWRQSEKEAQVNQWVSQAYEVEENDAKLAMQKLDSAISLLPQHDLALQARHDLYLRNEFYQQTLSQNTAPVYRASFSPDDSLIMTHQGNNVYLWNRKGICLDSIPLAESTEKVALSSDGKYLFVGNQALQKINFQTQEIEKVIPLEYELSVLQPFSAGTQLLLGDISGQVMLMDLEKETHSSVKPHTAAISALAISPNENLWLSAGMDGRLCFYNQAGNLLDSISLQMKITSATFSPDGTFILVGLRNGLIQKRSLKGQLLGTYTGHQKRINSLLYSPDGQHLLTASDDGHVMLWDMKWRILKTYRGHRDYVHQVTFSPDGNYFLSASEDGTAKLWKLRSKVNQEIEIQDASIQALAGSKDGNYFLIGTGEQEVSDINAFDLGDDFFDLFEQEAQQDLWLYDAKLRPIKKLSGHEAAITATAIHPENRYFLSGDAKGKLIMWDQEGEEVFSKNTHQGQIFSLSFAADGASFLSASADKQVILWSSSGDSLNTFVHDEVVSSALFIPNKAEFFTGAYDGAIRRWSSGGQLLQSWQASEGTVETLVLSPDGKWLASGHGGQQAEMKIWDLQGKLKSTHTMDAKDQSGGRAIYTLAFTTDSKKLIGGGEGGNVQVFDLDGRLLQTLDDFEGAAVYGVALGVDDQLICGSSDGTLRCFRLLK